MIRIFILFLIAVSPGLSAQTDFQQGIVSGYDQPFLRWTVAPNTTLFEFGKAFFGKVRIPVGAVRPGDSITVRIGEKKTHGRVDMAPGGTIRHFSFTYTRRDGDPDTLILPNKKDQRNTSGNAVLLPDWMGIVMPIQFVEIELHNAIVLPEPTRVFYHYRFNDKLATFTSSDTILNRIWDLCKHTIKATSFSGLYVDGDRERIPYEADALINQLSHYAVDTVYEIARNTIEYLFKHPTWPTEWHLQMHQLVWYDYLYTGNDQLIRNYYDLLKLKTLTRLAGKDGLISTTATVQPKTFLDSIHYRSFDAKDVLRDITDWPQRGNSFAGPGYKGEADEFVFCPHNSVVNAFHYRSLVLMQKFARLMNNNADEKFYRDRANMVRNSFRKNFIDPVSGLIRDGDTTEHNSAHANFFALCFGLIEKEEQGKVLDFVVKKGMACSVYGSQFLMDALYENGRGDDAYRLLTSRSDRSWYHMIETGAGMTMEAWDIRFKPNLDWNHAWGAAPANLIAFRLMGLRPIEPGFKKVLIDPMPGSIESGRVELPTPIGLIREEIRREGNRYYINIQLPAGMKYEINKSNPILKDMSRVKITYIK